MSLLFICSVSSFLFFGKSLSQVFAPDLIPRASITITGFKNIGDGGPFGKPQVLDIYNFRARWFEPNNWNDPGSNADNRVYNLQCWLEQNGLIAKNLMDKKINGLYSGYNEKYQFPANQELFFQCRVRPINAADIEGQWRLTNRVRIQDVPIFFPGIDVDLRGISTEEFMRILSRAAQKVEAEGPGEGEST